MVIKIICDFTIELKVGFPPLGGRLTMVKAVLQAIPVSWQSLAYIPK